MASVLSTPQQVQAFLRQHPYNEEESGETVRSAEAALRAKTWHCLEATFIAAAILEIHGYPPILLSMESRDGLDHVLYVFKEENRWGAISRSRDDGLHGRRPHFRSLRDLVWSYYDHYIDRTGKITGYQVAHLDEIQSDWRASSKNLWQAEQYLIDLKHIPLKSSQHRYKNVYRRVVKQKEILPPEDSWW